MADSEGFHLYSGLIHIHTDYSDGNCSYNRAIKAARQYGYDYIIMSDHMSLSSAGIEEEGWRDGILTIRAYEHNDPDNNNHCLIFRPKKVYPSTRYVQDTVSSATDDGSYVYMCHPYEDRKLIEKFRPYPWTAWNVAGTTGFELVNFMSMWMEHLTRINFLYYMLFPSRAIDYPSKKHFDFWFENSSRKYVIGSVDAHRYKFYGKIIFPLHILFNTFSTFIQLRKELSGTDSDVPEVLSAIESGSSYIVNMHNGKPSGFLFYGLSDSQIINIGGTAKGTLELCIKNPDGCRARLLKENTVIHESNNKDIRLAVLEPGAYRAELWKGRSWWIITNPVFLEG